MFYNFKWYYEAKIHLFHNSYEIIILFTLDYFSVGWYILKSFKRNNCIYTDMIINFECFISVYKLI